MKALFQVGFEVGKSSNPWRKFPPGFDAIQQETISKETAP
jgi:hypothetical protein